MQNCPVCATSFDPLQGRYAPDGNVVCVPCGERLAEQQRKVETKSAGSAFVGAWGAVLIALVSFVLEFRLLFFLMPLVAIGFGGGTAYSALTNPLSREMLGWKRIPTVVVGSIAIVLGLLSLVVSFAARE